MIIFIQKYFYAKLNSIFVKKALSCLMLTIRYRYGTLLLIVQIDGVLYGGESNETGLPDQPFGH